jgi:hypothetical protein
MGYTDLAEDKITELIQTLSGEYAGNSYNLLNRYANGCGALGGEYATAY